MLEYTLQLLIPILLGVLLGQWLHKTYGLPPVWIGILGILGLCAGVVIVYKNLTLTQKKKRKK
jgi:F0F1-type ATP synthase assembly protein I